MRVLVLALALAVIAGVAGATGTQEDLAYRNGEQITIVGVVRVVGNEPFTRVAVKTAEGVNLVLPRELGNTLRDLQRRSVTVSGRVRIKRIRSADHKYEIVEYHLERAVLIEE